MTKVCISFAAASGLAGFPDFPPAAVQQLQAEFPQTKVVLVTSPEQRRAELPDTDVLYAVRFSPEDLRLAKQLKWLQLSSAGATHVLFPEMIESNILVTNSRGLYGVPIAEHVIGMMIMLARKLHEAYRHQLQGKWPRKEMFARYPSFSELHGRTAGVIGLGDIGLAVAERAKALGMRVIATKRTVNAHPPCIDELLGTDGLPQLLRDSDFVVIAAPLTPETQGLIGEKEFPTLSHEGDNESIHISVIGRILLVVVFDQRSSLGLVKLRSKQISQELAAAFAEIERDSQPSSGGPALPFNEITDEEIDSLFAQR